jgi:hypothetical protein
MPARTVVLTAIIASCVSSLVTLAAALLVLAPSIRAAPDPQAVQPVLRAERFELVDSTGQVNAVLGTHEDVVGLIVMGPSGDSRVRAAVGTDGFPIVAVRNPTGTAGIGLTVRADDTALFNVVNTSSGRVAVGAGLGTASADVYDSNDRLRAVVGMRPDGAPFVVLLDETGQPVWQVP